MSLKPGHHTLGHFFWDTWYEHKPCSSWTQVNQCNSNSAHANKNQKLHMQALRSLICVFFVDPNLRAEARQECVGCMECVEECQGYLFIIISSSFSSQLHALHTHPWIHRQGCVQTCLQTQILFRLYQGLVKGTILCFRNLYFYFRHGESTSTASPITSPASQKSKDLNKVLLLLQDLG